MQPLIDAYLAGPQLLRDAIAGMTPAQLDAAPIPGKWSTRQVICHLADSEGVYAERMKRVIAEDGPTLFSANPDAFAASLAYDRRDLAEELQLIEAIRRQMAKILQILRPEDFQRTGNHSERGPLTLQQLLQGVTDHIPHHIKFIAEKRAVV